MKNILSNLKSLLNNIKEKAGIVGKKIAGPFQKLAQTKPMRVR